MDADTCPPTPPTVFGTMSPKSPSRSPTSSPMDSKANILMPSDRASPDPNCAICLEQLKNKSFTNSCLHQFCFNCLLEWSKVKAVCPLCKQGFQSIIHNVRSIEDYDQYHLLPNDTQFHWSFEVPSFRYRTTMVGDHHRMRMAASLVLQPLPNYRRPQQLPWTRSRRQTATIEFRRSVYARGLRSMRLADITGRYRDISPEFFRANPAQLHRLVPWLNRELAVVLDNEVYASVVLDSILSYIQHHPINSSQMRGLLVPHIGARRTDIFLHEFSCFASSPYDMIGFDESVQYSSYVPEAIDIASSDSSVEDDDSDVILLSSAEGDDDERSQTRRTTTNNRPVSSASPVAGPSGQATRVLRMLAEGLGFDNISDSDSNSDTLAAQVGSRTGSRFIDTSDSDDCHIVGYVKPLHERTPEIITLDSDEEAAGRTQSNRDEGCVNGSNSATPYDERTGYGSFNSSRGQRPYSPSMPNVSPLNRTANGSVEIQPKVQKSHSRRSRHKKSAARGRSRYESSSSGSPVLRKKRHSKLPSSNSDSSCSLITVKKKHHCKLSSDSSGSSLVRKKHLRSLSYSSSDSSEHSSKSAWNLHSQADQVWRITERNRSSQEDLSQPLASRMCYSPPYLPEEIDSLNDERQKPKLRSIVITRTTNGSNKRSHSHSTSSHSSRPRESSSHRSSSSRHNHRSKHKSRGKEREKKHKRKSKKYSYLFSSSSSSSVSSDDFRICNKKRKSHASVIYSDSDSD